MASSKLTPRKRQKEDFEIYTNDEIAEDLSESNSFLQNLKILTISAASGVVFGVAMEKGRVFEPGAIQGQMLFNKFIMLKMFLSAVSSGMFSLSILAMLPATQKQFQRARSAYSGCFLHKGVLSSAVGAWILGVGMTVSGACPGMVLVQVGAAVQNAAFTLLGCLTGAALYGFVEPLVVKMTKPSQPPSVNSLDEYLQTPFFVLSLPLAAMMGMVVVRLEVAVPWQTELDIANSASASWINMRAWPPSFAGLLIGLLQVPIILAVGDTLGGSSSYCTLVSQALITNPLRRLSPYLSKFRKGIGNWWQVLYVGGAVLGGYLSAVSSGSLSATPGVGPVAAFIGGTLMIFGARMAAGCTSGHGLSGVGLLNLLSFVAVPAMFGGGIGTAVVMKAMGYL